MVESKEFSEDCVGKLIDFRKKENIINDNKIIVLHF